ncbi:hypothetical protein GGTG_03461 [Gaeumannomyces tritici R3-111a-1]|uniref:alcohol dehydrogenase n=1 Tax=Gaeumannomyces tritici (strain R3-111a-1) TaxID=644352 RepID=J3NQA4_GAET3|nr:hypothetical protein GGTG_03461 [Gaeumannomyces tritici R3-111a-1]EJT78360.1 hypothetical protein GGTG_03461 [Gaeumannomyces tritici R3-111a-1]
MKMPSTQLAAVLVEPGAAPKFEVQEIPVPVPGPNELLVRLSVTSICGSDYGMAAGHLGPTMSVLGHEGVGRVVTAGANAAHLVGDGGGSGGVHVGQRVAVCLTRDTCGSCAYCAAPDALEAAHRCEAKIFSGFKVDGTFAQFALVQARWAQPLPARFDGVPDDLVAPVLCGGVTAYKAVKSCGLTPGQWLAVPGAAGGVGAFVVAYGRAMGYRVIGLDVGKAKEAYVLSQGAESYVDVTQVEDLGKEVARLTGGSGVNAVVVTAGSGAAYQSALGTLAPFGTLMCVGIPPPDAFISIHPIKIIESGIKITGSMTGTRKDVLEALEFVRRGVVVPKVHSGKLADMTKLILEVAKGTIEGKYVVSLGDEDTAQPTVGSMVTL